MSTRPKSERWHLLFEGNVQGVGFRYTCRTIARSLCIGGWVRNLMDGRVEASINGEPGSLQLFVEQIAQAQSGRIENVRKTIESSDPNGVPGEFAILDTIQGTSR